MHGFLESGGSFTTIDFPGAQWTYVTGINDGGQVVGTCYMPAKDYYGDITYVPHGFLESGGSFTTIDVPYATTTLANGINDDGQVVGEYYWPYSDHNGFRGFLESGGSFTTIDANGASETDVCGINDGGQVVGYYSPFPYEHGFLESGGSLTAIDFPGAYETSATGINDAGLVVGVYYDATGTHGFLLVLQTGTTTALVGGQSPSVYGQPVTFTATVSPVAPGGGTPTGSVEFMDGSTTLGSAALSSGVATFSTTSLSVATHSITAVYGGDGNFTTSTSSAVSQTVNQAITTTSLTSSVNPSVFGQSVTFTATVTAYGPGSGTPTGTVTFMDGLTDIGTGMLDASGTATFATSSLTVGDHLITADYAGDSNYNGSSGSVPQTVNPTADLQSVSFAGPNNYTISSDPAPTTGAVYDYAAPQWRSDTSSGPPLPPGDTEYPVLYTANSTITVSASWTFDSSTQASGTILAEASGPDDIDIPPTPVTQTGNQLSLASTAATPGSFPAGVQYYKDFDLAWVLSFDGGNSWVEAGTSDNPMYVTAATPIPDPQSGDLFLTVVNAAVLSTIGGSSESDLVAGTWSAFKGLSFTNAAGEPLHYYNSMLTTNTSVASLLADGDGQCSTWAGLFLDMLLVNGINEPNDYVVVTAGQPGEQGFLVNNWNYAAATSGNRFYPYVDYNVSGSVITNSNTIATCA